MRYHGALIGHAAAGCGLAHAHELREYSQASLSPGRAGLNLPVIAKLYGGFFAIDLKLLFWVVVLCAVSSLGTVLAIRKVRNARQSIPYFLLGFVCYLILALVIFDYFVGYPIFVIKSFFELP